MARIMEPTGVADFDSIRLSVASADDVLSWSYGEVLKPETINYRTQKPERDGLFCERIFGPVKDINPHDNKLKGVRSREAAVDKSGNLVTKSITRRERMGHITLAAPVAHVWFMHNTPYTMSLVLGTTTKSIERVVYFASYMITGVDSEKLEQTVADLEAQTEAARGAIKVRYEAAAAEKDADIKKLAEEQSKEVEALEADYVSRKGTLDGFNKGALINEVDYRNLPEEYDDLIEVGMGAAAIKKLLDAI
ncbi:MAG: DNA-directed RNA polymerase subunit beta', partial [Candidatus Nomurabacteria bacterium]|nr:DNA-directed RNA polymerase subunit beta' [Candidatus Nomurabacteria bacterium]